MEKFGFSGLWQHTGSTVIAAALPIADALVTYLGSIQLPQWAHLLVGVASSLLLLYKGKAAPPRLVSTAK